jgi:hypothetical protein
MFTTTLFAAINAAGTVNCQGYEIDSFDWFAQDLVRLSCGDDTITILQDSPVEIDDDGSCTLVAYEGPEAEAAGIDTGMVRLVLRVSVPLSASFLPPFDKDQSEMVCRRATPGSRIKLKDGRTGAVVAAEQGSVWLLPDGEERDVRVWTSAVAAILPASSSASSRTS